MNDKKIYGNPQFDDKKDFLTEEEFLNKKVGKTNMTVAQLEQLYPGFKEKYARMYNTGKFDKDVIEKTINIEVLGVEGAQKFDMKKEWKERAQKGDLSQEDIQHLVNVMYGKEKELRAPQKSPEEKEDHNQEKNEEKANDEHNEFCSELKSHVYSPEQAAKNTAVREQKELAEQTRQQEVNTPQIPESDQPII